MLINSRCALAHVLPPPQCVPSSTNIHPAMLRLLPERYRRRSKRQVSESAHSDSDHIRPPITLPIHGRAASRAEMNAHLAPPPDHRERRFSSAPSVRTCSLAKKAPTNNGAPVRRWHSVQWQAATTIGSASASACSDPQQQKISSHLARQRFSLSFGMLTLFGVGR